MLAEQQTPGIVTLVREQKEYLQGFSIVQNREMRLQKQAGSLSHLVIRDWGLDCSLKSSGKLLEGREQEKDINPSVLSIGLST